MDRGVDLQGMDEALAFFRLIAVNQLSHRPDQIAMGLKRCLLQCRSWQIVTNQEMCSIRSMKIAKRDILDKDFYRLVVWQRQVKRLPTDADESIEFSLCAIIGLLSPKW